MIASRTCQLFKFFALAALTGNLALAQENVPLAEQTVVHFATVAEGAAAITKRDEYIQQMSSFDRQVRLKTSRDVSEEELLKSIAGEVLPWSADDIAKITPHLQNIREKIAAWKLKLPPVILLVKTSGREEGGAAYCRGPTIVLPQNMIANPLDRLASVLPHELFHVLSNQNPELREALYETIGFKKCNEVQLPEGLAARKLTNPDAPVNDHYLTADVGGKSTELMPILFSKSEHYDEQRGGTLFAYLQFKLLALENVAGVRQAALSDGHAVLLEPASVPGFGEQIGKNTGYIIHPEEVLADNFVFLLNGRIDLPSPRVVERMGTVLQAQARP